MFIMVPLEIRNILRKAYFEPEKTVAREMDMLREYIYTNIRERLDPSDAQLFLKVRSAIVFSTQVRRH